MLLPALALGRLFRLKSPAMRAFNQGVFRGNLVYVGLPVVLFALPPDSEVRATVVLALAPTIPFFNILSVLLLLRPDAGTRGRWWLGMLGGMARNHVHDQEQGPFHDESLEEPGPFENKKLLTC